MSSLDPNRLSHEQAIRPAVAAARRHGIKDPIQPLRTGTNHVFQAGDVVVRVAPLSGEVSSKVALGRCAVAVGDKAVH